MIHEKQIIIFFYMCYRRRGGVGGHTRDQRPDQPKGVYENAKKKGVSAIFRIRKKKGST